MIYGKRAGNSPQIVGRGDIEMVYGIIYKATGPTGKVYIGQTTKTLNRRKTDHAFRAKKQDRRETFQIALLNEGFRNFMWEQIDTANNKEELDKKEKLWIAHYQSNNPLFGYNTFEGGSSPKHTPETRRKISRALKGKGKGIPKSEEHRRKIGIANSKANKGKFRSDEFRKKRSDAMKGTRNHQAKISEEIAREIMIDLSNGMRNCDVARKHNVSRTIVSNIKRSQTWDWLAA